jgi:hypothetical protein
MLSNHINSIFGTNKTYHENFYLLSTTAVPESNNSKSISHIGTNGTLIFRLDWEKRQQRYHKTGCIDQSSNRCIFFRNEAVKILLPEELRKVDGIEKH